MAQSKQITVASTQTSPSVVAGHRRVRHGVEPRRGSPVLDEGARAGSPIRPDQRRAHLDLPHPFREQVLQWRGRSVTRDQVRAIAETKAKDLNAYEVEKAMKMIEGTARSMGLEVVG